MNDYEDIIGLPRPVSKKHPHMDMIDRAAQFSPFAALTGYGDSVKEEARLTDERTELEDGQLQEINAKLIYIREHIKENPEVRIVYFKADKLKEGGAYPEIKGRVRKLEEFEKQIVMTDGTLISFEDILDIEV